MKVLVVLGGERAVVIPFVGAYSNIPLNNANEMY